MEEIKRIPIFTNTFSPTENADMQIYRSLRFVRRLVFFLIGTAFLGYFVYWFVRLARWAAAARQPIYTDKLFWICLAGVALYVFLIVREALAPRMFAKREARRIRESYRKDRIELFIAFFDEGIEFHNLASKAETQIDYTAFKKISETKDLFLMQTQQKQLVALDKIGFDGTDINGFRAFIDEKCPNAKRKWKKEA